MTLMTASEIKKFRAQKLAEVRREFADHGLKPTMRMVGGAIYVGTHWSIAMRPTGLELHGDNRMGVGYYGGMGDAATLVRAIISQVIGGWTTGVHDFTDHRIETNDVRKLIARKLTTRDYIMHLIERKYKSDLKEAERMRRLRISRYRSIK